VNVGSRAPACLTFIWRCVRGGPLPQNGRRPRSGRVSDRKTDPEILPGDHIPNSVFTTRKVRFEEPWTEDEEEVKTLLEERESGVSYMIGHTCVLAHESSSAVKKFAVNVIYGFLRRNSSRPAPGARHPARLPHQGGHDVQGVIDSHLTHQLLVAHKPLS
jgi:hypothetical protein